MAKFADSEATIWELIDQNRKLREEAVIMRRCLAVLVYRAGGEVNLTPGELKGVTGQVRLMNATPTWSDPVSIGLEDEPGQPGRAG
jgi:hypothetical protein